MPNFRSKEKNFIKQVLNQAWTILEQHDDISYSHVQIIAMISVFQTDKTILSIMKHHSFDYYLKTMFPFFSCYNSKARSQAL
jgi:hypothetical protein